MKNILYKDTTSFLGRFTALCVLKSENKLSLCLNEAEKPPSPLQTIKINTSLGTCTPELEHLDRLAEPLLLPSHRWGRGQSEALSGSAGLQPGDPRIFWLCACQQGAISADLTSTENLTGEGEELPQLFSALLPPQIRSADENSPGSCCFISTNAGYGWDSCGHCVQDDFPNPILSVPSAPCRVISMQISLAVEHWQALEEQQSSHPIWPANPPSHSHGRLHTQVHHWGWGCCQLGRNCAEQEVRSWGKPALHGFLFGVKPSLWLATSSIHNPTLCFPPDDHICFPNVPLTDTRLSPELCTPMSAHIHL